jgi:heme a synthase
MVYFWARGCFRAPMKRRMLGLLALGGSQGLIGWWMVKSGLQPKPAYHTEPKVSVYRLFVHLNCAIGIFSLLLWNGLTLVRPSAEASWRAIHIGSMLKTRRWAMLAIHLLALTIAAGSVVAGLDAGKVFNTWPLMNGQYSSLTSLVPTDYRRDSLPGLRNHFENMAAVQFNHRSLAYCTYGSVMRTPRSPVMAAVCYSKKLPPNVRAALLLSVVLVNVQALSGIAVVLRQAPLPEALSHQTTSLLLLSALVYLLHSLRRPNKRVFAALKQINASTAPVAPK